MIRRRVGGWIFPVAFAALALVACDTGGLLVVEPDGGGASGGGAAASSTTSATTSTSSTTATTSTTGASTSTSGGTGTGGSGGGTATSSSSTSSGTGGAPPEPPPACMKSKQCNTWGLTACEQGFAGVCDGAACTCAGPIDGTSWVPCPKDMAAECNSVSGKHIAICGPFYKPNSTCQGAYSGTALNLWCCGSF
jgi:hypothetical protein